jgi:hypothetical protein
MQKLLMVGLLVAVIGMMSAVDASAETHHRIGVGVHYWTVLDDIDVDDAEENGMAYVFTYQLRPASLIKFGLDVEMLPEEFASSEDPVYAPQAYIIVGGGIYAGLGIGGYFTDGEFAEDPFYNLRAGLDFCLLPFIHVDLNANYRFEEWDDIKTVDEDISTDTITVGAAVRLEI